MARGSQSVEFVDIVVLLDKNDEEVRRQKENPMIVSSSQFSEFQLWECGHTVMLAVSDVFVVM